LHSIRENTVNYARELIIEYVKEYVHTALCTTLPKLKLVKIQFLASTTAGENEDNMKRADILVYIYISIVYWLAYGDALF